MKKLIIALLALVIIMNTCIIAVIYDSSSIDLVKNKNVSSSKTAVESKDASSSKAAVESKSSSSTSTTSSVREYDIDYDSDTVTQYFVDFTEPKRTCTLCGGAGYEECSACDGTGKSSVYSHIDGALKTFASPRCEVCNGKGRIKCAWCNGSGLID